MIAVLSEGDVNASLRLLNVAGKNTVLLHIYI